MGTNNLLVRYRAAGRIFELPCYYKPFLAKNHTSLEEEVARLQHKNAALQAAVDQIQKKESENESLIRIGKKLDKLKTIVQRPCSLKSNELYLHMQVVAPRAKPHNFVLVIPIAVAAFLVNIGISGAKDPTNNNILRAVQNSTPSDNTIKKIVRRAQQHFYKDVVIDVE